MFWQRLATLFRTIRAEFAVQLENNPQLLRQSVTTAAAVAVVAVGMGTAHVRGAEQRADAAWAMKAQSIQASIAKDLQRSEHGPEGRVTLTSYSKDSGLSARGRADLLSDLDDAHALRVSTRVDSLNTLQGLGAVEPAQLRVSKEQLRQKTCLAQAIYYEARSESLAGQSAVAEVIVNRTRSKHYPDSFCDVVFEGSWRSTGCQFTFTCDGSMKEKPRGLAWERAQLVAAQVMMALNRPITHKATHYHTDYVNPVWSATLVETTRVGTHIFYRFPSRRERAALHAAAQAARAIEVTPEVEAVEATPIAYQAPIAPVEQDISTGA
jgi:hypothetical protein